MPSKARSFYLDILFLSLVIGSLFFLFLGSRPLFVPDEGRYAEIAREMIVSGDFITPRLNGIIYFEKPVLFYWLAAAAFKLGGISIFSARSVNALLGLFGCLFTYYTARTLYNRITGLLAALVQASSLLFFVMAHMVSLDLTVTVFLSATFYSFLLGTHCQTKYRRYYFYAAAIFAALAVLTKGLIGILFPGIIIGIYALTTGEWRNIKSWHIPSALLLFLAVALPWHIIVQLQHPQFFHFYFIEQHFLRYTDLSIGHYEPIWYFIPYLFLGLVPWVVFFPRSIKLAIKNIKKDRVAWFLLIWATIIFLFFSFSKSKLIPYILPIFPSLAILIGRYVAGRFYQDQADNRFAMASLWKSKPIRTLLMATWVAQITLMAFASHLDTRTIQPLAMELKPLLKKDDIVVTYNQYYQDLPFYLEQRVYILNWQNELFFGMGIENTTDWMINDERLWQLWKGKNRVFIVISQNEWSNLAHKRPDLHFNVISEMQNNLLISNH